MLFETEKLVPPATSKALFTEFPTAATTLVRFSFNNTMNKHIDVVAMGSLPALANIQVIVDSMKRNCLTN